MNSFVNLDNRIGAVPFALVADLRTIDTGAGSEALYSDKMPALLTSLADQARVASIEASSEIEGVVVRDRNRAADITAGRPIQLRDRSEQELAGYRSALDYLYLEPWEPLNTGLILHLHKLLFQFTPGSGGQFKQTDNLVVDRLPDGTLVERFRPVTAALTPQFMAELIDRFEVERLAGRHHPVLLVGLFALDLLTIHPFTDGNGRVTRALTNALLQQSEYHACRYISLESLIARSADSYYGTLLASTQRWHTTEHDPWPWLAYFVGLIAQLYEGFTEQVEGARTGGGKQDRVRDYIVNQAGRTFQISDIRAALPGISDPTIRLVLNELKAAGQVQADGSGRGAVWSKRA